MDGDRVPVHSPERCRGASLRCFLDVRGVSAAWRVSKAHFWPAHGRHHRCRQCATDALALRRGPIGLRCTSACFHDCAVPACRLPPSIPRNVALAGHCNGRRQSGVSDLWLFQRAGFGASVCVRITSLSDHKAPSRRRSQDLVCLWPHTCATYSVQSDASRRGNKAALGSYVHQPWRTLERSRISGR